MKDSGGFSAVKALEEQCVVSSKLGDAIRDQILTGTLESHVADNKKQLADCELIVGDHDEELIPDNKFPTSEYRLAGVFSKASMKSPVLYVGIVLQFNSLDNDDDSMPSVRSLSLVSSAHVVEWCSSIVPSSGNSVSAVIFIVAAMPRDALISSSSDRCKLAVSFCRANSDNNCSTISFEVPKSNIPPHEEWSGALMVKSFTSLGSNEIRSKLSELANNLLASKSR